MAIMMWQYSFPFKDLEKENEEITDLEMICDMMGRQYYRIN